MIEDSDMLRPCEAPAVAMGSCFSTFGESRGDACRKGFDIADDGVGRSPPVFGDRLTSAALKGVIPADVADAGVWSCVRLDLELSFKGVGEPLRPITGDLGGTSGGDEGFTVSTLRVGLAPGLRIGDNGRPDMLGDSCIAIGVASCEMIGDGPVMHDIIASPNGPVLQAVPGALFDLSWPKISYEGLRRGGLPGIVASSL